MRAANNKNYLLAVLTAILVFNYMDRWALGLALQQIKGDLSLSDTQLGLLSGIAFALFYSIMGVPIARWADRGNRVAIISVTVVLWSIGVALCSMVRDFGQLLMIRVWVAVGEAGCVPPALSLITDHFARAERPRAAGIYGMGGGISHLLGFCLAGWSIQFYGWRETFMFLGSPGVVLAALAWFTLHEPRGTTAPEYRSILSIETAPSESQPSLKEVFVTLWKNKTFKHLLLCLSVIYLFTYGILQWQPAFLIRSFNLKSGEVGTWLALSYGLGGLTGSYAGGIIASRYAAADERLQLKGMMIAISVGGILAALVYLSTNKWLAVGLMGLSTLAMQSTSGPLLGIIQTLVPDRMRAVSFSLVFLFANLIGMGFGPLVVGALSDTLGPSLGEESLRYALMICAPGYLLAAWHARCASSTVARDLTTA